MKKNHILTFTLNPAYDLMGSCKKIEYGEVNRIQTHGLHAAGKGINVAKVLRDLGMPVTVSGFLGEENKEGFSSKTLEMPAQFHTVPGRTRINMKLTDAENISTDFNFSGFEINPKNWEDFYSHSINILNNVNLVVVSGSLPIGIDIHDFSLWIKAVKEKCPRLVFDSSGEALKIGLKVLPWLVKPNLSELKIWAGVDLSHFSDVVAAAKKLHQEGIEHVIVSLGDQGAIWIYKDGGYFASAPACKVVSTVGAGDSMVAGLIYGLLTGKTYAHSLRLATAISCITVSQSGVGIDDIDKLDAMMARVNLQPLS
ncbi:1-phosphofructokinase [Candidatus Hamiltonella defensa]|nr:1-phosphofructokinase [Candidatus Hamiltonella defensa]